MACARVVWSRFLEVVPTSAKINFLNSLTPISVWFGQGVCVLVGIIFTLCIRREDDGKPYLHKSGSSTHEAS